MPTLDVSDASGPSTSSGCCCCCERPPPGLLLPRPAGTGPAVYATTRISLASRWLAICHSTVDVVLPCTPQRKLVAVVNKVSWWRLQLMEAPTSPQTCLHPLGPAFHSGMADISRDGELLCMRPSRASTVRCTATAFVPLTTSIAASSWLCWIGRMLWQLPEPGVATNRAL